MRPTLRPRWHGYSTDRGRTGMYDIAEQVAGWLAEGRAAHVAQVVATRGFSSRDPGAAFAWTEDGGTAGSLLPRLDRQLLDGVASDGALTEITVTDDEALAAGLSCGGVAIVLVQAADALPADLWPRLERREPVCLVTVVDGASTTELYTPQTVRGAAQTPGAEDVPRLFARGTSSTAVTGAGDRSVAAVTLWPARTLLVVGDGAIADALAAVATVLGWVTVVVNEVAPAVEVAGTLSPSDAVIVLSHDHTVDVPILAAVLAGSVGYVGALGSRHTQAERRAGLTERGVDDADLARIHGPAGLDLDAHTPAEIAISIVAEVLAVRAGTSGTSISHRGGPVHNAAGVSAPPPRY